MSKPTKNDEMVLGMIMNPETPFEAVELQKTIQEATKVDSRTFEKQYEDSIIVKYKASE